MAEYGNRLVPIMTAVVGLVILGFFGLVFLMYLGTNLGRPTITSAEEIEREVGFLVRENGLLMSRAERAEAALLGIQDGDPVEDSVTDARIALALAIRAALSTESSFDPKVAAARSQLRPGQAVVSAELEKGDVFISRTSLLAKLGDPQTMVSWPAPGVHVHRGESIEVLPGTPILLLGSRGDDSGALWLRVETLGSTGRVLTAFLKVEESEPRGLLYAATLESRESR